jgi:membrane-associated phospholipid phosphatase
MVGLKKNLLIPISAVTVAVVVLFAFDDQIGIYVRKATSLSFIFDLKLLSRWGLFLFYAVFAGLLVYSLILKDRKLKDLCLRYIVAQAIFGFAVVRCMKIVFGRARPEFGTEFHFFSFDFEYNSFPSGHAADAFVSGLFLFHILRNSTYSKFSFLPLAYASLIALLRVADSAHHPSDIVAGMAIGILGAYLILSRRPDRPK